MSRQRIHTEVTSDNSSLKRGMQEAAREIESTTRSVSDQSREVDANSDSWRRMAETAAGVFGGLQLDRALRSTTDTVIGLAREASNLNSRYETLGVVMNVVGRNAGYNRVEVEAFSREVRSMGITLNESRNTVIQMAQAQMDLTQASQLARVAQDAAVIGNTNSSAALERVVYGIQSAQVQVLRTIGLNVDFERSYRQLAEQLGRNVDHLTEAEKTQARMNAVMEAGAQIAGSYEASMDTAGKKMGSLTRYIEDAKLILGEMFNEALIIAVDGLTGGLQDLNDEAARLQQQGQLREWGRNAVMVFAWVADAASVVKSSFGQAWRDLKYLWESAAVIIESMKPSNMFGGFAASAEFRRLNEEYRSSFVNVADLTSRFQEAARAQFETADAARSVRNELDEIFRGFSASSRQQEDIESAALRINAMFLDGKISADEMRRHIADLSNEGVNIARAFGESGAAGGLKRTRDAAREAAAAQKEFADAINRAHREALAAAEADAELLRIARDGLDATHQQIQRQREHNEEIGVTGVALVRLRAARLEDTAAQHQHTAASLRAIPGNEALVAAYEEQAAALLELARLQRDGALSQAAWDGALETERAWQQTAQAIEQDLTDALMRGFESGQGFAENFRNTLRNMINTMVLRPVVQAIVQPVAGQIAGAFSGGAGGQLGGGMGMPSGINPTSLLGSPGGVGAVGPMPPTGLYASNPGLASGISGAVVPGLSAFGFGQQYGVAGGVLGGVASTALAGGMAGMAAGGAGFLGGAGAALMGLGPVGWAALIGGALLGSSMGPKTPTNYWQYTHRDAQSGAITSQTNNPDSRRHSPENLAASQALSDYAVQLNQALFGLSGRYAIESAGFGVGSKDKELIIDGESLGKRGISVDAMREWFDAEVLSRVFEDLSADVQAIVLDLQASGRELAGTLTWVTQLDDFNRWLERLAGSVLEISVGGADAAAALAELAGGVENLAQLQRAYHDQFFSDAERAVHLHEDLSSVLSDLGMEMVGTRDGYRALVEGLDVMTEAGREAYVTLLALAPEVTRYFDLLDTLAAEQDAGADVARNAADAARAYRDALNAQIRVQQDAVNQLQRLAGALRGALERMDIGTIESEQMRRQSARAQLGTAAAIARASDGRVLPELGEIAPALDRVAQPSAHLFSSFEDYARDFYETAHDIHTLAGYAEDQLSIEQQALKALRDQLEMREQHHLVYRDGFEHLGDIGSEQTDLLSTIAEGIWVLADEKLEEERKKQEQRQRGGNDLSGEYRASDYFRARAELYSVYGDRLGDLYNLSSGHSPLNDLAAGWERAYLAGEGSVVDQIEELIGQYGIGTVPGFAAGGDHAGGWRVVGERGWELEHTGPSHIYTQSQAKGLIDIESVTRAIVRLGDDLRAELRAGFAPLAANTHRTARTLDEWTYDGLPGERMPA